MPAEGCVYRFGSFELDAGRRRLTGGGALVSLPNRQLDVLLVLTAHAGRLVSKDMLSETVWEGLAVTDNSIVQAVKGLRETLGSQPDGEPYIESHKGRGYRFLAPVERAEPRPAPAVPGLAPAVDIHALLEPYRAFVDGRAALETLDREAVGRAGRAFAEALRLEPDLAIAHIGMANVLVLVLESTRADGAPDPVALVQAEHHARESCRLAPSSGDAWSALAVVRHQAGDWHQAIAAARKAVALEPQEWRHQLRLAWVSWGPDRLTAALRALSLRPGLALAHWFAATVFVARGAFDAAFEHLRAGCAAQDAQRKEGGRFAAVGLHWLHGLVLAAVGASDAALAEFARELELEDTGHVYGRECCANTWYAIGALLLRQGNREEARSAFQKALALVPRHVLAGAGLEATAKSLVPGPSALVRPLSLGALGPSSTVHAPDDVARAMVAAVVLTLQGKHDEASRTCGDALVQAAPGSAGWLLPVEPLLHVSSHAEAWAQTLATLRDRAT